MRRAHRESDASATNSFNIHYRFTRKVLCWRNEENISALYDMTELRLNAYHIMWLFVFFDLPVTTKKEMKAASLFRKNLEKDGFSMMQFSVYIRHCASKESMDVHVKRVKALLPESGKVSILCVTDKQFGNIYNFWGKPKSMSKSKIEKKYISEPIQLEIF